jgi:hypothetical protein
MPKAAIVEAAWKAFAEVTGAPEDATIVAADGQAAPNLSAARQSCDCLIALLEASIEQPKPLRRRLG